MACRSFLLMRLVTSWLWIRCSEPGEESGLLKPVMDRSEPSIVFDPEAEIESFLNRGRKIFNSGKAAVRGFTCNVHL